MIECTFLNNTWVPYNIYGIKYQSFINYQDYIYCNNGTDRDQIFLHSKPGKILTLSHSNKADIELHPLCKWDIAVGSNEKKSQWLGCSQDSYPEITLNISRNSENYEEIYVELETINGWEFYDSKSIAQWGSETVTFYNTTKVKVMTKKLNNLSNLSIEVSEKAIVTWEYNSTSVIFILSFVGLVIFVFIVSISFILINNWMRKPGDTKRKRMEKKRDIMRRVDENMNSMVFGKGSGLQLSYDETTWAIWLENYKSHQSLHILNGCKHSFHSLCL